VPYSKGGSRQKNPAHFIDFLAAVACLDFFRSAANTSGACYYAGPREQDDTRNENVLAWPDIPSAAFGPDEIRLALLKFALVGAVHIGFVSELSCNEKLDEEPHFVPWYKERFTDKSLRLTSPGFHDASDLLTDFFNKFHYTWLRQIHDAGTTVRLFNHSAVLGSNEIQEKVQRLANLLYPDDRTKTGPGPIDEFFTDMVETASHAGGQDESTAYLSLLDSAAARFVNRKYGNAKEVANA
jgi:hypothetical protein